MHFCNMDAYYHMAAQGDADALNQLYKDFSNKANIIIRLVISSDGNFAGIPADFYDLVDKVFFKTLAEYDSNRGSFATFVDYVMKKRLGPRVKALLIDKANTYAPLDITLEDFSPVDAIADPDQLPMRKEIAIDNFKVRISSKNKNRSNLQKLRDRILRYQFEGRSLKEIAETLCLTKSELRTILRKMQEEDVGIINLKLELK